MLRKSLYCLRPYFLFDKSKKVFITNRLMCFVKFLLTYFFCKKNPDLLLVTSFYVNWYIFNILIFSIFSLLSIFNNKNDLNADLIRTGHAFQYFQKAVGQHILIGFLMSYLPYYSFNLFSIDRY
jgi:hypothetical protein